MLDDLADVERVGPMKGIRKLRPRSGSVEEFERHTFEAGHPVSWDEARGVFRDPRARIIRVGERYLVLGHAWEGGPILFVVLVRGEHGIGTLITARPATENERRTYRQKGK